MWKRLEGPAKTPEPEEEVYNSLELFPGLYPEEGGSVRPPRDARPGQ